MSSVRVVPAAQATADPAVMAMIARASNDHDLCHATYLPAGLDETASVHWLSERVGRGYAVLLEEQPVGWMESNTVKDSCGFDLPDGSAELEIWLLPHARGQHIFRLTLTAIEANLMASGVTHLVGVAWATNQASVRAMRSSGFEILGDGWWGDTLEGGICTVGLLTLGSILRETTTA